MRAPSHSDLHSNPTRIKHAFRRSSGEIQLRLPRKDFCIRPVNILLTSSPIAPPLRRTLVLIAHALHGFQLTEKNVRPGPRGIIVSAVIRTSGLIVILLVSCVAHFAAHINVAQHHGTIICREEVPAASRDLLAQRLRLITGWPSLKFDDQGSLRAGEATAVDGSITARNLLSKALSGNTILILEDASNRSDVAFSRVVPGRWQNDAFEKLPVFVVLIDFADFDHLMGDRLAREAFNAGWGVAP